MLPKDHYKVFRALTVAGKIDRAELLQRLGFPSNTRDRDLLNPLCSIAQFRHLRGCCTITNRNKFTQDIAHFLLVRYYMLCGVQPEKHLATGSKDRCFRFFKAGLSTYQDEWHPARNPLFCDGCQHFDAGLRYSGSYDRERRRGKLPPLLRRYFDPLFA